MRGALWLAVCLAGCGGGTAPETEICPDDSVATWETVGQPLLTTWCTPCHASAVPQESRNGAPLGMDFETLEGARRWSDAIFRTAGAGMTMPPAGGMPAEDRALLAEWVTCDLPGTEVPDPVDDCAEQTATTDPEALCRDGANVLDGDLASTTGRDLSCLCVVDGDLLSSEDTETMDLPALVEVTGSVRIAGDVVEQMAVGALKIVGGDLQITDTTSLTTVELGSLAQVGGEVQIQNNGSLQAMVLPMLGSVPGSIRVEANPSLRTLDLARLLDVEGDVVVADNAGMERLLNLDTLRSVGGDLRVEGNAMVHFSEFVRLASVGGDLVVANNPAFPVLIGLLDATRVEGAIRITGNDALETVSIGRNLTEIPGTFEVTDNPSLLALDPLNQLVEITQGLTISRNEVLSATPAFDALVRAGGIELAELPALTAMGYLSVLEAVDGDVVLRDLPSLEEMGPVPAHTISGAIVIEATAIVDARGLALVRSAGRVSLHDNDQLGALVGFGRLHTVDGDLEITDNAVLDELGSLFGLELIQGDLTVTNNPRLSVKHLASFEDSVGYGVMGTVLIQDNGS